MVIFTDSKYWQIRQQSTNSISILYWRFYGVQIIHCSGYQLLLLQNLTVYIYRGSPNYSGSTGQVGGDTIWWYQILGLRAHGSAPIAWPPSHKLFLQLFTGFHTINHNISKFSIKFSFWHGMGGREYLSQKQRSEVTYSVIQEESALLWEMIVWVILGKKVHTNMGPILNSYGVMGIF